MARYTVLVPKTAMSREDALESAVFVREGWRWGGFFFGPFWLARHGHWLSALLALLICGLAIGLVLFLPIHPGIKALVVLLFACLFALEGPQLRRFALTRAGFLEDGVAVGDGLEEIERRYFAEALRIKSVLSAQPTGEPPQVFAPQPQTARGIIGLFPQAKTP